MLLDSFLFVLAAGPIALVSLSVWRWLERRRNPQIGPASVKVRAYPKDKVILFTMGPSAWCPSASPFVLKLQTYLRMAGIAYKNENNLQTPSSKGKFPWVLYKRQQVEDTTFIIDHLNKATATDLNSRLDEEKRAISRAFQKLIEDEMYWIFMVYRYWNKTDNKFLQKLVPDMSPEAMQFVRRGVMADAWANGVARHREEDLGILLRKNLNALSAYIGNKPYFMGGDPSEADASLFGLLAQARWQMPNSLPEKLLKTEFFSLGEYCDRVRDVFFPDWNDLITHGGTRPAKDPEYLPPVIEKKAVKVGQNIDQVDQVVPESVSQAVSNTNDKPQQVQEATSANEKPVLTGTDKANPQPTIHDDDQEIAKSQAKVMLQPEALDSEGLKQNGSTPKMPAKSVTEPSTTNSGDDEKKGESDGNEQPDPTSTNANPHVKEEVRDRSRPRKKFGKLKRGSSKDQCKQS